MDTYMHKTVVSVVSLEKIEIVRNQEFMLSEARLKFLRKIILGPKTAILGPQFCRILVLGPHFWWSRGGARAPGPPRIRPWNIPNLQTSTAAKHCCEVGLIWLLYGARRIDCNLAKTIIHVVEKVSFDQSYLVSLFATKVLKCINV